MAPGEIQVLCHMVDGEAGEVEEVSGRPACLQAGPLALPRLIGAA